MLIGLRETQDRCTRRASTTTSEMIAEIQSLGYVCPMARVEPKLDLRFTYTGSTTNSNPPYNSALLITWVRGVVIDV